MRGRENKLLFSFRPCKDTPGRPHGLRSLSAGVRSDVHWFLFYGKERKVNLHLCCFSLHNRRFFRKFVFTKQPFKLLVFRI